MFHCARNYVDYVRSSAHVRDAEYLHDFQKYFAFFILFVTADMISQRIE